MAPLGGLTCDKLLVIKKTLPANSGCQHWNKTLYGASVSLEGLNVF